METILKGDASATMSLALAGGFDYEGKSVVLEYQGVRRTFANARAGGTLTFSFTAEETAAMSLGAYPVFVRIEGGGEPITVHNAAVKIRVTDCVEDVRSGSAIYLDVIGSLHDIEGLPARYTDEDLKAKVNEIIRRLGGTVAALLVCALPALGAGVTVLTAPKGAIYNDQPVVTNVAVDLSGLAISSDVAAAQAAAEGYADAKIAALPPPDFTVSNDTLVATIEATAPAPGNYAAVSNAAMSALHSETDPSVPSWAKGETPPLPPDYATVSNHAMTALQSFTEVDPTVPSWAKAESAPMPGNYATVSNRAMTALQTETDPAFSAWADAHVVAGGSMVDWAIDAMYAMKLGDGFSTTYSADDITAISNGFAAADESLSSRLSLASLSATNYTDEAIGDISFPVRSVNQKTGAVTLAASDVGAYSATDGQALAGQVTAIGAHLNGEDAKVIVTNYNSSTHLPEAEFDINVSNNWLVVWREMTRWNWFLGDVFDPYTNAVAAALANKAEKEYAFFDGVTGEPAPDGFFWISQPRVAICAGAAYQRYVDTAGEVWVLESNGMVADINGTTNGYFRISDDKGNVQFEIVKGDSRTVTAAAGAMTRSSVMGVTHWHTTYMVTNAVSAPKAMFCRDIANPEWYAEDDPGCPCNVDWTHPSEGIYVCEWWTQGDEPKMFMRSQCGQGSESRIVQNAPVEMQTIVIGGVKGTLGTATINGITVLTFTPGTP